ncbi:MAG: hypothetical protein JOZ49_00540 [Mycolicibacterium sp.]|nr:hypothetical protein [Mycolicibacterium sp.]
MRETRKQMQAANKAHPAGSAKAPAEASGSWIDLVSRHSRWIISRLETDRLARVSWVRIMLVTLGVRGLSLLRRVGARLPDVRGG